MTEVSNTPQKPKKKYKPYRVKTFDWDVFANLVRIQCTEEEIAYTFDMSIDTLSRRCMQEKGKTFAELRKIFASDGKCDLRRRLWRIAFNDRYKDTTKAAIWLSKNYLGMRDSIDPDTGKQVVPIIIENPDGSTIEMKIVERSDEQHTTSDNDRSK